MPYTRLLNLEKLLTKKSHFLFGPRATGKSTLIEKTLVKYQYIDLLNSSVRLKLLQNPSLLEQMIQPNRFEGVVIDEVQKIPEILDEVQRLMRKHSFPFLLTGSSARKLKRGAGNLLGGRARTAALFPLVTPEIPDFDLDRLLLTGGLPSVYTSDEPFEDLKAYVDTYLKEEILAEGLIRTLAPFARFLQIAAQTSGQLLNYAAVGSDSQVNESTVRNYYQILTDTLLGSELEPFCETKKRKAIQTAKFYFFDVGVTHQLLNIKNLAPGNPSYGNAFEAFIAHELRAYLSYRRRDEKLTYWRSKSQYEVDFCLGRTTAIEVKAKETISDRDLKGLRALAEENIFKKLIIVCRESHRRQTKDKIQILPVKVFLEELWGDQLI